VVHCYSAWAKVADAVIEAAHGLDHGVGHLIIGLYARHTHLSTGEPWRWRTPPSCSVATRGRRGQRRRQRSSVRLSASQDNTCLIMNSTPGLPSRSITRLRNMLESFDNRARSEKRNGKMFCRYAEWPKVADAVSEAKNCTLLFLSVATQNPSDLRHIAARERMGNMRCF